MLRVVFDPGVLISALLSREGAPAEALDRWREGEFDLVVSPKLLGELESVLGRPKFRPYLDEAEAHTFVAAVARQAITVEDPPSQPGLTPDPGDDYVVALARAARADLLVSGDKHLLFLRDERPAVVTPRELLDVLSR